MDYISRVELKRILYDCQAKNELSDELLAVMKKIVWGCAQKWKWTEVEDIYQESILVLLRYLPQIDPEQTPFSYLTTAVVNTYRHRWRRDVAHLRKLDHLKEHLATTSRRVNHKNDD